MKLSSHIDWDDFFSYSTPKVVVIKDRYLGILRLALLVGTFVYFVLIDLGKNQRYLDLHPVDVLVQMKLKEPKDAIPITDLPYCSQDYTQSPQKLPCIAQPYEYIIHGSDGSQLFVTTKVYWKTWTCLDQADSFAELEDCEVITPVEFVAHVEDYDVVLVHSSTTKASVSMDGYLLQDDGSRQPVKKHIVSSGAVFDQIPIKDFLRLIGISSLDDDSGEGKPLRYQGLALLLTIHYHHDWRGRTYEYTYSLERQDARDVSMYTISGSRRTNMSLPGVVKRSGLRITVGWDGEEGAFGFAALMMAVVQSLALIAISSKIVDIVSTKFMSMRHLYSLAKFEATVDFSDFKKGDKYCVDAVNYMLEHSGRFKGKKLTIDGTKLCQSDRNVTPSESIADQLEGSNGPNRMATDIETRMAELEKRIAQIEQGARSFPEQSETFVGSQKVATTEADRDCVSQLQASGDPAAIQAARLLQNLQSTVADLQKEVSVLSACKLDPHTSRQNPEDRLSHLSPKPSPEQSSEQIHPELAIRVTMLDSTVWQLRQEMGLFDWNSTRLRTLEDTQTNLSSTLWQLREEIGSFDWKLGHIEHELILAGVVGGTIPKRLGAASVEEIDVVAKRQPGHLTNEDGKWQESTAERLTDVRPLSLEGLATDQNRLFGKTMDHLEQETVHANAAQQAAPTPDQFATSVGASSRIGHV